MDLGGSVEVTAQQVLRTWARMTAQRPDNFVNYTEALEEIWDEIPLASLVLADGHYHLLSTVAGIDRTNGRVVGFPADVHIVPLISEDPGRINARRGPPSSTAGGGSRRSRSPGSVRSRGSARRSASASDRGRRTPFRVTRFPGSRSPSARPARRGPRFNSRQRRQGR